MGTYAIASIHKEILKAHIASQKNGGCHCFQSISKINTLKNAITEVRCTDKDDRPILEFLKENHIVLNESPDDWGWEPKKSTSYKRNCILLREFINEINTIPLHSFVYDLFYSGCKAQIENQILNTYTKFLCSPKDEHFSILDEAKITYHISHFLIRDYNKRNRLKIVAAKYGMYSNFKSFICNDQAAVDWWNSHRSQMENSYDMNWSYPLINKPDDLLFFRAASTSSAKERSTFEKTWLADEDFANALNDKDLILIDYVFGLGNIAGEIVDSLDQEIRAIKQDFYEKFEEICEKAWKLSQA